MRLLLVTIVTGLVVATAGVLLGAWWTPFVIGLAFGLVVTRPVVAIGLGAVSGFLAWLLPLLGEEVRYGLGPPAATLAAIMGFGHQGAIPVGLTLLVGTLLGLTGAWLTSAIRMLIPRQNA